MPHVFLNLSFVFCMKRTSHSLKVKTSWKFAYSADLYSNAAVLIGHFWVPQGFCSKMRLSAQPLIWKYVIFHSHANKTHFHKKGCALGLILKRRVFATRNWSITVFLLFRWAQKPVSRLLRHQEAFNRRFLFWAHIATHIPRNRWRRDRETEIEPGGGSAQLYGEAQPRCLKPLRFHTLQVICDVTAGAWGKKF